MPISFVDSNTQDSAAGLNLTFVVPAATVVGDLILVFVKQSENTTGREWDDDGGGGNGYIRIGYNRSTGGRDQETAVYYKIATSNSEPNPTFTWASGITAEPMSGSMLVYRGVDEVTPINDISYRFTQNNAAPPSNPVNVSFPNSVAVALHAATHDDISSPAAPTGYTLRSQVWNGANDDHRNNFTADIVNPPVGSYTAPDWQHSVLNTTPESHAYVVVLNEVQPIGANSITPDEFNYTGTGIVIDGFGFGATQAGGNVQLWSDIVGTISTVQTVTAWSDTQITFTAVQGSLPNNSIVYAVVTNDDGDSTAPIIAVVGSPPYDAIILGQEPDHWWQFDNDGYADSAGLNPLTTSVTGGGGSFVATPICKKNTHSWYLDSAGGDRREPSNSDNMNNTTTTNRLMGGWVMAGSVSPEFVCIYEEGGGVNNLAFFVGVGNSLITQLADTSDDNVQAFGNQILEPNRPYHILFRFSYTDPTNEFRLYVDGELQDGASGNPLLSTDLDAHGGDISFGGPGGNLEVAGTDVLFQTAKDFYYAQWVTWSESKSQSDITALFESGALPRYTIASDTPANMQADLDSQLQNTEVENYPIGIEIEEPVGTSDLTLVATGITFNELCSRDISWRGIGTLTWVVNVGDIDESKILTLLNGNVVIQRPSQITVTGLTNPSEVRIYEAGTTTELGGQENVTSGVFVTTVSASSVDIVVLSLGFKNIKLKGIASVSDITIPITQQVDRQYENV